MKDDSQTLGTGSGLLIMAVLGALAFWGLGALAATRYGDPLQPPQSPTPKVAEDPMQRLREGTQFAVDVAVRDFSGGDTTKAVIALDAARRCARVGRDAGAPGFGALLTGIEETRKAVQNGSRARAPGMLAQASRAFAASAPTGRENPAREAGAWDRYAGAMVVNAEGVRVGEFEFVGRDATVVLGNARDVFGFLDFGGTRVRVPTASLIPAATSGRGITTVVLPVHSADPASIKLELLNN